MTRGLLANLFSTALRIVSQVAFLPVLFAFLPADDVGLWSMAWSVPAYLVIAAQGMGAAGANAALQDGGGAGEAGAIYRRVRRNALAMTMLAWLLAWIVVEIFAGAQIIRVLHIGISDIRWMALFLGLNALCSADLAALEVPLRFAGRYPTHITLGALGAGAELLGLAAALMLGGGFAEMAFATVVGRASIWFLGWRIARRVAPALLNKTGTLQRSELLRPALAFMLLPLVYAINLQGYVLLVGAAFGTAALAAFLATRMIARLFDLFTNFLFSASFYETAHSPHLKGRALRGLAATTTLCVLVAGLAFWTTLMLLGPLVQRVWTLGQTQFDPLTASVIAAAAMFRALAAFPSAVLAARNNHARFSSMYLALSVTGIVVACALVASGAPLWVAMACLMLAEAAQTCIVMRQLLRYIDYLPVAFLRDVFSRRSLRNVRVFLAEPFLRGQANV